VLPGVDLRWNIHATDGEGLRLNIKKKKHLFKKFSAVMDRKGRKERKNKQVYICSMKF
jgi:hypothetical protein